jgi:H+/Cl- antiporter ClcA
MQYRQFLLIMLAEVGVFASFVVAGVWTRKPREVHRSMMLLATLSVLTAATIRIPNLVPVFGAGGLSGIFGPMFALGAILLIGKFFLTGSIDNWLAVGYASMVTLDVVVTRLAMSDTGRQLADIILRLT